jgi:hypothetical protein
MCSFRWYNHKINITVLGSFITVAYIGVQTNMLLLYMTSDLCMCVGMYVCIYVCTCVHLYI